MILQFNIPQNPSEVMVYMDYNSKYSVRAAPRGMSSALSSSPSAVTPHLGGQNRAYADGYVKWTPGPKVFHPFGTNHAACDASAVTAAQYNANPTAYSSNCDPVWNPFVN